MIAERLRLAWQVLRGQAESRAFRAAPGQRLVGQQYSYGAPRPEMRQILASYAASPWVFRGVSTLAESVANAPLRVARGDRFLDTHPLLEMLGEAGQPNDYQDSFEFWEGTASDFVLVGNAFWYWEGDRGGRPFAVHRLQPDCVEVVPGIQRTVEFYRYLVSGVTFDLPPENITHFRRYHPMSKYFGLSGVFAASSDVRADLSMADWNNDFFGEDVFTPAGVFVVPTSVTDADRDRLEDTLNGAYGGKRRTAVMRADPGAISWLDAGLRHRDLDFRDGREMSRKAIYEAIDLPLGLMSEASTEAHARVAERRLRETVARLHTRFSRKINSDAMMFWGAPGQYMASFADVRLADYTQERQRWETNRIRKELNEPLDTEE